MYLWLAPDIVRPSFSPWKRMPTTQTQAKRSSDHPALRGGNDSQLHRRKRLDAASLSTALTCSFSIGTKRYRDCPIVDVSTAGLAFTVGPDQAFAPGTELDDIQLMQGQDTLRVGSATCVYQKDDRVGARVVGGYVDVDAVRVRALVTSKALSTHIEKWKEEEQVLSTEWRATTAQLGNLLQVARERLEHLEKNELQGSHANSPAEREAIEALYRKWGPLWEERIAALHHMSAGFDKATVEVARTYSERIFVPQFVGCPAMRRIIEKPEGYAGDYQQIRYINMEENVGDTIYDRFVHHLLRRTPLRPTILARQRTLTRAVLDAVAEGRPAKIVAIASGPVIELCDFLKETPHFSQPVELVLLDQDPASLAFAQDAIDRTLAGRSDVLPVRVTCVHSSVRQILKPDDAAQAAFLQNVLGDATLLYSAGLFDYLPDKVAVFFVLALFRLLAPGGELIVGNLREAPGSTWMLEFALAWFLIYREREDMTGLAGLITHDAQSLEIKEDPTGFCLFLHARKSP